MSSYFKQGLAQQAQLDSPATLAFWYVPILLIALLVPCALISLPLFHTLSELFAIGIAMMSFVVAWNTFSLLQDRFTLFLGIGYFWVGSIDLLHTLTFKNMVGIESLHYGATVEFWVAARFLEASILLLAPFLFRFNFSPKHLFYILGLYFVIACYLVFSQSLPRMIDPGSGLTNAKLASEFIIVSILSLAILAFYLRRQYLPKSSLNLLYLSIILTIMAELSFTLYTNFKDAPLILGHIFKLLSFWLIYRLLIESALLRPIKSMDQVVKSYDSVDDATVILNQDGYIQYANSAAQHKHGKDLVDLHCHEWLHDPTISRNQCPVCLAIEARDTLQGLEFYSKHDQQWYEASVTNIMVNEHNRTLIHSVRQVSTRKNTEQQVLRLSRLYQVLGEANKAFSLYTDMATLFQTVCDIGVNQGAFKMVWIGIIDGATVKPEFYAGAETGYLKEMKMRVDDSEWAQGPVGVAAKTKRVAYVNDVLTDPSFEPWREAAIQRGYCSLAAVPIIAKEKTIGLFTLYSEHKDVFDSQMITVLENLSRDLSSSLYHLEQEAQRLETEATISKLSQAVSQSVNGILIADMKGRAEYINAQFTALTGFKEKHIIGKTLKELNQLCVEGDQFERISKHLRRSDSWKGELPCLRQDGSQYWALISVSLIVSGDKRTHFVVSGIDNTDLHEAQETIRKLAFFDALTGVANRRLLMDRMQHAITLAQSHNEYVGVLLCDLDNFKTINDSLGHDAGDILLKRIADDLNASTGTKDTVARLGGDEFVVIVEGVKDLENVVQVANAIFKELSYPGKIKGTEVSISSSMGISIYPQDGHTPDELLRNADLAMYHAKDKGKNCYQFYQQDMNRKIQERLALEQRLRTAVAQQSFHLVYQAQVEIETGNVVGYEALVRWIDGPNVISPADFIPLAEETGLIEDIGAWVIEQAVKDWKELASFSEHPISMAVNVSARQFEKADLLYQRLSSLLESPTLDSSLFTVEITEGTLIGDVETTTKTLNKLKELGLTISVDDFGTGYSSLNYLKRFPIDQLKIDRSFIDDLLSDENDQAIVSAIIAIAQKLDIKLVAEGVELREQGLMLKSQGCHYAQGFYYYKPQTLSDIREQNYSRP